MNQIDIDRYNKGQDKCMIGVNVPDQVPGVLYEIKAHGYNYRISLYDLLLDPEYGWRETFDKDPDYQREFWEWLRKKKYGDFSHWGAWIYDTMKKECGVTPQMLTGYILEFMQERMK